MPVFFDEHTLDEEQLSRYQWSLKEYNRIQLQNADKEKQKLKSLGKLTARIANEIDNKAKSHQPSNKSALFWRLLQGKSALPHIPPTSFSYPWYQIIEEQGAFEVMVNWKKSNQHMLGMPFLPKKRNILIINQAIWSIQTLNHVGAKLLHLDINAEQEELKKIFNSKPELIVKFRDWNSYKLFLGRKIIYGRRDTVLQEQHSLDSGGGNTVVLEVINRGEDTIKENRSQRIELLTKNTDVKGYDNIVANVLANNLIIPENPNDWDWLKVEVDGWMLQKI